MLGKVERFRLFILSLFLKLEDLVYWGIRIKILMGYYKDLDNKVKF